MKKSNLDTTPVDPKYYQSLVNAVYNPLLEEKLYSAIIDHETGEKPISPDKLVMMSAALNLKISGLSKDKTAKILADAYKLIKGE